MTNRGERDREAESRRILGRLAGESERTGLSFVRKTIRKAGDHVSATDAEPGDPIELWGTRIGRMLGILIMIGLMFWLALLIGKGV